MYKIYALIFGITSLSFAEFENHTYGLFHAWGTFDISSTEQEYKWEPPGSESTPTDSAISEKWSGSFGGLLFYVEGYNYEDNIEWQMLDLTGLQNILVNFLGLPTDWDFKEEKGASLKAPTGTVEPKYGKVVHAARGQIGWKMFSMFDQPFIWAIDVGALKYPNTTKKTKGDGHVGLAFHYLIAPTPEFRIRPFTALGWIGGNGGMAEWGINASYDFVRYFALVTEVRNIFIGYKSDRDVEVNTNQFDIKFGVAITGKAIYDLLF